jgi:hypothetical protein
MAAVVRPVSYAEILNAPNAAELLKEYAGECSIPKIGQINPQAELYAQMEQSGRFQVFGAFDDDDLAGFAAVLVYLNPHYGKMIATVESLFLARNRRNSRTGNSLMNAIENYAKEKDCEAILYSARTGSQFEKLLTILMPYQRTNSVFLRRLQP